MRLRTLWRLPLQLFCAGGLGMTISSAANLESAAMQNAVPFSIILAVTLLAGGSVGSTIDR